MKKTDHEMIQQVLDGELSQEEFAAFQDRLRAEPEFVELYGQYALLQHVLCEEFGGEHALGVRPVERARRILRFPAALAIAAALALVAAVWTTRPWEAAISSDNVAAVTFSVDAAWRIDGPSQSIGGATALSGGSVLHLECGTAAVWLSPSVTGVVEGPAQLTFRSKDELFMRQGRGYFTVGGNGGGLTLETPRTIASELGTEFGIEVPAAGADEILVADGSVRIVSKADEKSVLLAAGDAAQIPAVGGIWRFPADDRRFAKAMGRFRSVVSSGDPAISSGQTDGGNYSNFLRLPAPVPSPGGAVVLTTLDVSQPDDAQSDGFARMGFFSKGSGVLHIGGSGGDTGSPGLDPSGKAPTFLPQPPSGGLQRVTLRYDPRTGDVSLHEGGLPLGNMICSGKIPPGSEFDEIRLATATGGELAVNAFDIRVGGE